jgi:hypothetical protein
VDSTAQLGAVQQTDWITLLRLMHAFDRMPGENLLRPRHSPALRPSNWTGDKAGTASPVALNLPNRVTLFVESQAAAMCCPEPPSLSLYLPSSPPEVRLVMLNARKQAANLLEEGTRPERLSEPGPGILPSAVTPEMNKVTNQFGSASG